MITDREGEAAVPDIERWANQMIRSSGKQVQASVLYDGDSSTYILRLSKGMRVLVFRLSEAQLRTEGREGECEKTLIRKVRDLLS